MTKPSPEVEALAAKRLADDEARITGRGARRQSLTLGAAFREFVRHPSPWLVAAVLVPAVVARVVVGGGDWWELAIPVGLVALFPFVEWSIHVVILHWRPRDVGRLRVDSLLAREHRAHHADPRDLPLVFIPWRALLWLLPSGVGLYLLVFPTIASALTMIVSVNAIMLGYEWTHYLIHSDYRPRTALYRHLWRNHRLHHYKNEHYWFGVVTAGTADRLLGTYPDTADVPRSPTVKALPRG